MDNLLEFVVSVFGSCHKCAFKAKGSIINMQIRVRVSQ